MSVRLSERLLDSKVLLMHLKDSLPRLKSPFEKKVKEMQGDASQAFWDHDASQALNSSTPKSLHLKPLTPQLQSPCISSPWLLIHFVRIGHVAHVNGSRRTYKWVTSHIWMGHVAHMNGSRRPYKCAFELSLFLSSYAHLSLSFFSSYAHFYVRRDTVICATRSALIFVTSLINMHCAMHAAWPRCLISGVARV